MSAQALVCDTTHRRVTVPVTPDGKGYFFQLPVPVH
jgi:hypothetical protein